MKNARVSLSLLAWLLTSVVLAERPHPATNPESPMMLSGAWLPEDSHQIDFALLPSVPSEHAIISDVRDKHALLTEVNKQLTEVNKQLTEVNKQSGGVNQHNYLVHYGGQFWAMWSDGPGVEDRVGQRVKYATSRDGLQWSEPLYLTPVPPHSDVGSPHYNTRSALGMRWISRGFWIRDGELLALASLDEAAGFFGSSLELRAFRYGDTNGNWEDAGCVFLDTINNFPPQRLPTGDWMMSRRKHDYKESGVHFLVGGVQALDHWQSFPVLGSASELKAEEPDWWILPDKSLSAVFRDNRRSGYLYRAFSTDNGRTWTKPVQTNFPDATSKVNVLQLQDGRYVLVSNPNPARRDPLAIAISTDGLVFTKMLTLIGGRRVDYPHLLEHDGSLFIAFSGGKQTVEVLKVRIADLDAVQMPDHP